MTKTAKTAQPEILDRVRGLVEEVLAGTPHFIVEFDVRGAPTSGTERPQEWVLVSHNSDELRRVMWDYVGIVRSSLRLERAFRRTRLLFQETEDFYHRTRISSGLCELRNMIAVAYLIIRSAQMRRESRGLHHMLDYPDPVETERRPSLV